MRILVFSDSHGDVGAMIRAAGREDRDMIIHLGDSAADADRLHEAFPDIPMRSVAGNSLSDAFSGRPVYLTETFCGIRVYMSHGHRLGVKSGIENLIKTAITHDAALALYGHTHIASAGTYKGIRYLNPGCINRRFSAAPGYGILEFEEGKIKIYTMEL